MTHNAQPEAGERLVKVVYEHWIRFIGPLLLAVVLIGISLLLYVLAGVSAHHYAWLTNVALIAGMSLFCFTTHWFFLVLLGDSLDCMLITNKRLLRMQYRPFSREDVLEISFQKMKTVDAEKKGILQNLLRYGTLHFETNLASIPYVAHPNRVAKTIQEVMNNA